MLKIEYFDTNFVIMSQLRELYLIAYDKIKEVIGKDPIDFRFEQFKEDEKSHLQEMVVSYLVESKKNNPLPAFFQYERIYKIVQVNDAGKLIGILIYPN